MGQYLVYVEGAMPSGVALTAHLNSLMNSLMHRMSYYYIARNEGLEFDEVIYDNNVYAKFYGDDSCIRVSEKARFFNLYNLSRAFDYLFGMKMTSITKEEITEEDTFLEADQVSFLKRNFEYRDGDWYGILPLEVIQEIILWQRRNALQEYTFQSNLDSFCLYMSRYGRKTFDEHRSKVRKVLKPEYKLLNYRDAVEALDQERITPGIANGLLNPEGEKEEAVLTA